MPLASAEEQEAFTTEQRTKARQEMLDNGTLSVGLANLAKAETRLRHAGQEETAEYTRIVGELSDFIDFMKQNGQEDEVAPVLAEAEMRFEDKPSEDPQKLWENGDHLGAAEVIMGRQIDSSEAATNDDIAAFVRAASWGEAEAIALTLKTREQVNSEK